ncbi:MAG: ACP S-malonyltransferase [Fibrobacter sp.]|nr:ACP S-malonyltransferase [Fibrobacter sp.]
MTERGIAPDVVLGHSLGEITSLAASEIVTPHEAVKIAAKRGELMDLAAKKIQGGMMAIMFMDLDDVVKLLDEINEANRVVIANDNAPCQVVLSGEIKILEKIASEIQNRQLGKSRMVNVTGPWHSPFLDEARNIYKEWAENITFNTPKIPVVFNALAKPHDDPQTIKNLVAGQLALPVFWRESMETLRGFGVNTFYEIGPGRVLTGLVRANGFKKGNTVYNINCIESIESL